MLNICQTATLSRSPDSVKMVLQTAKAMEVKRVIEKLHCLSLLALKSLFLHLDFVLVFELLFI